MLARFTHPAVIPLEIWDAEVAGVRLCDAPRDAAFGARLLSLVRALAAGEATLSGGVPAPPELRGVRRLHLCGGGAAGLELPVDDALVVDLDTSGLPTAERAGLAALAPARGLVVDVGQTAIKVSDGSRRARFPRDLARLPANAPASAASRGAFVDFVAGAIRASWAAGPPPEGLALALPCEVSSDCSLGPSSYPYEPADPTLLAEIVSSAGLDGCRVIVANDAELAAASVALRASVLEPMLVVTIGFGVGAALVRAEVRA